MEQPARAQGRAEDVRLLFFRSAGERFFLDVSYVREIIPQQDVTPVPFVPDTVAGILNHRGTIYTLIRFARLAGLGDDRPGTLVLLRLPEMAVGIAVEDVEGIELVDGRLLQATAEWAAPPTVTFLRRVKDRDGRLVHAIDAEVFIDAIYQLPELARVGAPSTGPGRD